MKRLLARAGVWWSDVSLRRHRRIVLLPYWRHMVDTFPDVWEWVVDDTGQVTGIKRR